MHHAVSQGVSHERIQRRRILEELAVWAKAEFQWDTLFGFLPTVVRPLFEVRKDAFEEQWNAIQHKKEKSQY